MFQQGSPMRCIRLRNMSYEMFSLTFTKGVSTMGFLEDVFNTGKNVVSTAGKKTDEAVKLSKLKIKESQINSDIRTKFEKLGEMIYQMKKSGEQDNAAFEEAVAAVDECYTQLDDVRRQIDELKNQVTCPKCGLKTKDENSFCPKCGTKLPEKPAETVEENSVDLF